MSIFCESSLIHRLIDLFGFRGSPLTNNNREKYAADSSIDPCQLVAELHNRKYDIDVFINMLNKNQIAVNELLMLLEDEIDQGVFVDMIQGLDMELIEKSALKDNVLAFLYYLRLKVSIIENDQDIPVETLFNKDFDFSVDRLIAEFINNALYLRNLYKFMIYAAKDVSMPKYMMIKRVALFEWLSDKLFRILVFFTCNIDLYKDNRYFIQLIHRIEEYCELNERYLLSFNYINPEPSKRSQLQRCVNKYATKLVGYFKLFALNKDKHNVKAQIKILDLIHKALINFSKEDDFISKDINQELKEFKHRLESLKAKSISRGILFKKKIRRAVSEIKPENIVINPDKENISLIELDEPFNDYTNSEGVNHIQSNIKTSSISDYQSTSLGQANTKNFGVTKRYKFSRRNRHFFTFRNTHAYMA